MPVENMSSIAIACDNHVCSHDHSELSPNDRTGWLFVTSEVYGKPTQQHVYCCPDCAAMDAPDAFLPPEAAPPIESIPMPPYPVDSSPLDPTIDPPKEIS